MTADPLAALWDEARDARARQVLAKLVLAAPRVGGGVGDPTLKSLTVRPIELRGGPRLQLVYRHERRDVTRNLTDDEAWNTLAALVPATFHHVHLHTTERTVQLERRGERWKRTEGPASHARPPPTTHDRQKQRAITLDPRWTEALGLTDATGRPLPAKRDKHRQVLRFVEVLDHWLADAPRPEDGRARWVDVGSGSGALTFAAWEYLRGHGWPAAELVGVELRAPLAEKCEAVARSLGCEGLAFRSGAVAEQDLGPLDGLIALHACDTATDDALATGITAGARYLLVAPCCHKEVRPQLVRPPPLAAALRHGILAAREAEIATDALRAGLLGAAGYEAKVFEFVSSEHTDKNLMISATRRGGGREDRPEPQARALEESQAIARFYGIGRQRLAERLGIVL